VQFHPRGEWPFFAEVVFIRVHSCNPWSQLRFLGCGRTDLDEGHRARRGGGHARHRLQSGNHRIDERGLLRGGPVFLRAERQLDRRRVVGDRSDVLQVALTKLRRQSPARVCSGT
jgi:hypothetical protein